MTDNKAKLSRLVLRKIKIESRKKYLESPGVLRKVIRQIKTLESV